MSQSDNEIQPKSKTEAAPAHPRGSSRKKKPPVWPKILAGLLILLLLLFAAGWGYTSHLLNKMQRPKGGTLSIEDFIEETDADLPDVETLTPEEVTLRLADQVLKDKDVVNLLLIGQDTQGNVPGTRSDSIILATINQKKKEITITSFMRDLYVDIPGYKKSRINAAYSVGGAELLDKTIERNFGIHIDGNIAVDFSGFSKCVDIIGGVDIDVTTAEAACINKELYQGQKSLFSGTDLQADRWALVGGMQHLTGKEALQYVRIRKIDSDFSRTNRQRKLLSALFDKVKSSDLKNITALLEEALPLLTTDISNTKLIGYAAGVLTMQPASFRTDRIPADGTFREAVIHQMQVLVPDLEKNQQHLKESLYGSDSTSCVPLPSVKSSRTQAPSTESRETAAVYSALAPEENPYETAPDTESLPESTAESPSQSPETTYQYGPGMPSQTEGSQTEPASPAQIPQTDET